LGLINTTTNFLCIPQRNGIKVSKKTTWGECYYSREVYTLSDIPGILFHSKMYGYKKRGHKYELMASFYNQYLS